LANGNGLELILTTLPAIKNSKVGPMVEVGIKQLLFNNTIQSKNMKKIFLISITMIVTGAFLSSCKKDTTHITTEDQAVQQLLQSESFADFSKTFVPDVADLLQYHRSLRIQKQSDDFKKQVSLANNDELKLANTYRAFSLNFENAVLLRNRIDNDLLRLFNQNKFLSNFNETQTQSIILNALDIVRTSTDPKWQPVKEAVNNRMTRTSPRIFSVSTETDPIDIGLIDMDPGDMYPADMGPQNFKISWDEVWTCLKEAVGFGTAGILGIAGLKKLASEGFQEIIITTTKFLAKHAGWFGLAIAVIDFSSCMYRESND
jgi:hypothetical protein